MNNTETIDHIDHSGIVVSTNPARNTVTVRVDDKGECGTCPAASICGANGEPSNLVTITTPHAALFRKNDIVTVRGTEKMHRKAISIATVLPCIILVAVMVGIYLLTKNQLIAALSGIGTMIVFFVLLWFARNKIAHEFSFEIVGAPERAGYKN